MAASGASDPVLTRSGSEPTFGHGAAGGINYTPDFLIRNETTGQVLAVEIKSGLSLSLANIIKFQRI
jgi:hypothetical protein